MVPVDWRSYISLGLDSSASLPCNSCEYHYFMITCQMAILLLLKRKEKENELTVYFSGSQKCYACSYIMTKVLKMPQSLASNCVLVCHLMVSYPAWLQVCLYVTSFSSHHLHNIWMWEFGACFGRSKHLTLLNLASPPAIKRKVHALF
jgi:hypothetical protein